MKDTAGNKEIIGQQVVEMILVTAYIRLLISGIEEGEYCIRFQLSILKYLKISAEDIEIALNDYKQLNL